MSDTTTQPATETESGGCGCGGCGCGGDEAKASNGTETLQIVKPGPSEVQVGDLDVRGLPREERHAQIFGTFGDLTPGESFILVNDHDPLPMRAKLEAVHVGELGWEYLAQGPTVWRIQITKVTCC
ncbi:MAG: DUF2249 domain-containing protein [Actinomycetales bacterium]|nr:DUF2249 domain-containing protein [Actinomycetales bacterium]